MMPMEKPFSSATRDTFWRTLQTFSITRIVIALVLLAFLGINAIRDPDLGDFFIDWRTCVAYLLVALGFAAAAVYVRRRFIVQLVVQIVTDIVAISLLYVAAGGAKSGLAILYLFPLAGCAIMVPLVAALFFVSIVTLLLLIESSYQVLHSIPDASPSRAGLYGAAFFAAIYVINRLAAKLIKQEDLAAQRGRYLQLQEAINRLVIADMGDGILVVGQSGEVFAGNPAVERMTGLAISYGQSRFRLADVPSLAPIAEAFNTWAARCASQSADDDDFSTFVRIKRGSDSGVLHATGARESRRELLAHLKLRFAKVKASDLPEDRTVIFLQDVTEIENQAQQLKLASMGRLTASIAHEVRNPLSAISHAASLLREEIVDPTNARLLNIVGDNVVRLNRMIEDILKLSRKAHTGNEALKLARFFAETLSEFRETHALPPGLIAVGQMQGHEVRFDPLHLREVVVNLLSNALRYASGKDGSIRIMALSLQANRLELHVQDDGPAISPEVRAHLFEPFYTTSSKGTGLGLYVARELCLNNGAMLDYEYRMDLSADGIDAPSGRFVITFAARA
jgi:two-component system, NtrC family, sensor histidine kinase PilS